MLDCAPSLDRYLAEAEAAAGLCAPYRQRAGSSRCSITYRWLAGVLRGESAAAAGEAVSADRYAGNPVAHFIAHLNQANAAAIFGDQAGLERHTAAAMPTAAAVPRPLPDRRRPPAARAGPGRAGPRRGRGPARRPAVRTGRADPVAGRTRRGRARQLPAPAAAGRGRAGLGGRATSAPPRLAFDAARREAAQRQRPWHRALIAEHAARFYLARGLEHAGHDLLAQARQEYLAWGATAKVAQLDWAYPALRPPADATAGGGPSQPADCRRRATVTTGTIDLLGILSASQALSSETSVGRLHARVVQVLSAMTGATAVHLLLWDADRQDWLLPAPGGGTVPARGTGQDGAVPMSVLRYVQRTGEPLVVGDAAGDDRFARDPYFTDITRCSLLAVPIVSRGALRAVLLLENRLLGGAFTAGRLDAVQLSPGSSPSPWTTPSCTPSPGGSPASRPPCGGSRCWSPRRRRHRRSSPRSPGRSAGCWRPTWRSWTASTRQARSRSSAPGPARVPRRRSRSAAGCRSAAGT